MHIEIKTGMKTESWSVYYQGYCYYESYGPSMTDWGRFYNIDELLAIKKEKDIEAFNNSLPEEIGGLKELVQIIISEIKKEKNSNSEEVMKSEERIPLILEFIKELKLQEN